MTAPLPWHQRLRRSTRDFLELPAVDIVVLALILVSVVLLVLEIGLPAELTSTIFWLDVANYVLTGLFAVELSLRFWVARSKARFFRRYWLDILALLPVVRPLRMLRLLRLLRLWRAGRLVSRRLLPFQGVFAGTLTELTTLATVSLVLVLSAGLLLNLVEGGSFASLEASLWYAVMSLIAGEPVGGEPTTQVGRWATLALMLGGLTVFGMFVGTVSAGVGARLAKRMDGAEMDIAELEGHVVVCGWNGSAPTLLRELFAPGTPRNRAVVVITEGEERPDDWPWDGVRTDRLFHLHGDWTRIRVLEKAGIPRASTCILLRDVLTPRSDQDRDARTVLAALTIEPMSEHDIYTVAELHSAQSEDMLRNRGVEEVVVGEEYAGMILGSASQNPGLVHLLSEVLDMRAGNAFWSVPCPEELDGKTVRELRQAVRERFDATLMSIEPVDGPVQVNPPDDAVVRAGMTVLVVGKGPLRW